MAEKSLQMVKVAGAFRDLISLPASGMSVGLFSPDPNDEVASPMQAKDAIRHSIDMADTIMDKYLNDLDDEAFLMHPVAGMNHIAWQIGHLISSADGTLQAIKPGCCPPLPEGFDAKHSKETTHSDDPKAFYSKDEYLEIWKAQREGIKTLLESLSDADLDAPAPERIRAFCPTIGHTLNLFGGLHPLMHVGQFVAVRRATGKPVVF